MIRALLAGTPLLPASGPERAAATIHVGAS